MQDNVLFLDFMNFAHRARVGFNSGDNYIIYNFFRSFRLLIEQLNPNKVFIVLEGKPNKKIELYPDYKLNRNFKVNDEKSLLKHQEMEFFFDQVNTIKSLLSKYFPVTVIRHPDYEADDTIYNFVKLFSNNANCTVVSNDSDFIQLLNEFDNVKIYNPHSKSFVEKPNYDYVSWKSLKGDSSDYIKGIKGIGEKRATKIVSDLNAFNELLSNKENKEIYDRNKSLIKFETWIENEFKKVSYSIPQVDWDALAVLFKQLKFDSILNENSWFKFKSTFQNLTNMIVSFGFI